MILQFTKNIIYPQWFAGIGTTLLLIHIGLMGGWASPTLVSLAAPDSAISLTPEQASWVASILNFSCFFGGVSGPIFTHYLGSKRSILITAIPIAIGWLIIALANVIEWLYVARLSCGLGLGMAYSTFPLYIGEVSMPEIRGALISLATVGASLGQVIASVCGSYFSMNVASSIYLALAVLLMGLFLWLPESPHYLVNMGKREEARKSIDWYRAGRDVDQELEAVERFIAADESMSFVDKLKEFKTRPIRKATFQIIAVFAFMQICGLNVVLFFIEPILIKANITLISPSNIVIHASICGTISSAISIFLIDRCGRRFLLLISSIGTTVSMVELMSFFMLMEKGTDVTKLQCLPMSSMFIFMIAFYIGLSQVPSTMLSETFPANTKCIASCIAILTTAVTSFLSAITYQPMVDAVGEGYVFMIYAILSATVIPYALFVMPETKGKSLQQIQDELMSNS